MRKAALLFCSMCFATLAVGCGDRTGPDPEAATDTYVAPTPDGVAFPDSGEVPDAETPPDDEGTEPDEDAGREDVPIEKDEGNADEDVGCLDQDGDGAYGKSGYCPAGTDCNDKKKEVHPDAEEVCGDGIDQNCDGDDTPCCEDKDGDGVYGVSPICPDGADCDDDQKTVHPTAKEVCGNDVDENCDGKKEECCTPQCDGKDCGDDGCDGLCGECADGTFCNDAGKCVEPTNPDSCEGKCGQYDEDATCQCDDKCFDAGDCCDDLCDLCAEELVGYCGCKDEDGDGYGEGEDCEGWDCNDTNPDIHPDAEEVCGDGIDQDCDDKDTECPVEECTEASDKDGDGIGSASGCDPKDCNDDNKAVYPGAKEICGNDVDEDCDGKDEECPTIDCKDEDGDGYGEGADCKGADCNDQDPSVNPEATEDPCGDGVDQDCDGEDPKCPDPCVDADGDGHAVPSAGCESGDDCNDDDPLVYGGAKETCGDDIDQDCDGKDEECPSTGCSSDADCEPEEWCQASTGTCLQPNHWQWWAPVVYLDTDKDGKGLDFFTTVDFDGDEVLGNNGDNATKFDLPAKVYYSTVQTDTHIYVGYHFYFPRRWSDVWLIGTNYENTTRSVLLVIRKDAGAYGAIDLMVTTGEGGAWKFYKNPGSKLMPYWYDDYAQIPLGTIQYDDTAGHARPIIYMDTKSHDISGDEDWDTKGFPGKNGWILRWDFEAGIPEYLIGETTYALEPLVETLWPDRFDIGDTWAYDSFGHFAGDDTSSSNSTPPWGMRDGYWGNTPYGELLWDPATMVRRSIYEWGTFDTKYTHNVYALRVDLHDLYLYEGEDGLGGLPDPFINLFMRDGRGEERKMLAEAGGYQNSWKKMNVELKTLINLKEELKRYWFYGLEVQGHDYFGIEVKDDDAFADDWLMDPEERSYHTFTGVKLINWVKSDSFIKVHPPSALE